MATKARYLILCMFLVGCFAFAQTGQVDGSESSAYSLLETEEGTRFVQRIEWAPISGILRYEIILERRFGNSSRYDEFLRESTNDPFLELSIPAGNYRYKVLGYNILDRLGAESDFQPFEVFQAVQPVISEIVPNELFLDEDISRITLIGERFVLGSEIYLLPVRLVDNAIDQEGVIIPSDIIYSDIGDTAELVFDGQVLPRDNYRIVVVNPGGLHTSHYPFSVKRTRNPIDISVSLGYAPFIPIGSNNELNEAVDKFIYPLGFAARISFVPIETSFGYFGLELSPFFSSVKTEADTYTLGTKILGASLSVLYQKPFLNEKLFLNFRLGGGVASYVGMQFEFVDDTTSDTLTTAFPEAQFGISAQYFVREQFFVELGADYKLFFAKDMLTSYLNPVLSAGWKF
ncbi:MAG: hypothetical protein LBV20_06835 [Treponema sp.]|jgi:hypothetical protein|nr:hypothetical protein [Treponema sp.]